MDLSQLSDDELNAAYEEANRERQAAAELKRKNYVPTQDEIDEAERVTGLKDASTLYKFNAGLLNSAENLAKQPGRLLTEVIGDEGAKAQARKEVDEERKLMSHAGTAGAIGGLVGDIGTALIPGTIALKGAKALGAGGLLSGTAGYAAAGAGGSLLSAKGTGDSYLLDAGLGAVGGAALGNLIKGGTKAVQRIFGAGSQGKAKREVADYLSDQISNMDDTQKTLFTAAVGKYLKSPKSSLDTPGQVLALQEGLGNQALKNQADLIKNQKARYAFEDLNVKQQKTDLDVIQNMANNLGSVKLINDLPPADAVNYYLHQIQKARSDATREGFKALKQMPAHPQLKQDLLLKKGNPEEEADIIGLLNKAANDESLLPSQKEPLMRLKAALQAKPGTAYNRPMVGDFAELYQYMNKYFPDLDSSAATKVVKAKNRLGQMIGQYSPEFAEVNKTYAQLSEPLNKLQESKIAKIAYSDPESIFKSGGAHADKEAQDLGRWMAQNTPEALNQMTANKVLNLIEGLRLRKGDRALISDKKLLDRLEMINGNNPMTKQIITAIKEHLVKPKNLVNKADDDGKMGFLGKLAAPVNVLTKLHDEKYQRALLTVLSDTKTWAPIASRILDKQGKDGLITLLDMAAMGLGGTLGADAALTGAAIGSYYLGN